MWVLAAVAGVAFLNAPDQRAPQMSSQDTEGSAVHESDLTTPLESEGLPKAPTAPVETPEQLPTKSADKRSAKETEEIVEIEGEVKVSDASIPEQRPSVETGADRAVTESRRNIHDISVGVGGTLTLPAGEVTIDGNIVNTGSLDASKSTLILDGADQTIEGNLNASKVVLRGGTKRIRGGTFGSLGNSNAQPGEAGLYVEADTTLIIEEGGKWNTPNPYGFQIAGSLVIDGGEFHCRFSNGNGTDRGEDAWLPGSTLTIFKGKFVGNGDADFSGATLTIHDGALEINDDIWNSGDALNMYGGSMRNTTGGGMFYLTGTVTVSDGKLQVYQSGNRSLRVHRDASVFCTGGEISINGSSASSDDGGIMLGASATLSNLKVNTSTKISSLSVEGSFLSVSGDFEIAKGRKFEAKGFSIIAAIPGGDDQGEFIP